MGAAAGGPDLVQGLALAHDQGRLIPIKEPLVLAAPLEVEPNAGRARNATVTELVLATGES